jgi:hypothetical protein
MANLGQFDTSAKTAFIIILVAVISANLIFFRWLFSRARFVLNKWVEQNNYRLLEVSYARPWWLLVWALAGKRVVYRVRVRNLFGEERVGWVMCGSLLWGLCSDRVKVTWDKQA